MKQSCKTCRYWQPVGYKDITEKKEIAFCSRYTQVTNADEINCIGYDASKEKENYFRNLEKAKQLKVNVQQQIQFEI